MMRLLRVSLNTALRKNGEITLRRLLFSCLYRFRRGLKTATSCRFPSETAKSIRKKRPRAYAMPLRGQCGRGRMSCTLFRKAVR